MASITIRYLDDDVKTRRRMRAADNGRSTEQETQLHTRWCGHHADWWRQDTLASDIEMMLHAAFENRILAFDSAIAGACAEVASLRRAAGRSVLQADCQITAMTRSRGMTVATRNVRDFVGIVVPVPDPIPGTRPLRTGGLLLR